MTDSDVALIPDPDPGSSECFTPGGAQGYSLCSSSSCYIIIVIIIVVGVIIIIIIIIHHPLYSARLVTI